MLKGVNQTMLEFSKPRFPDLKPAEVSNLGGVDTIYGSDEFRMYTFKIKRCTKTRSHDWTECPFAHRGEKARRRDPRKFNYYGIACPEFRRGVCPRGDACELAHGVFEFWLHPARYRTRACKAGQYCRRKVCFFAHTAEQLRTRTGCMCGCSYLVCVDGLDGGERCGNEISCLGDWDFVEGMRELKIGDGEEEEEEMETFFGAGVSDSPDIDWVSELVS